MDLTSKIQVFKKTRSFEHLDDDTLAEIAVHAIPVQFKKGEFIFQEEDEAKYFYVIISGRVKLFKQSSSGKNFIAYVSSSYEPLCGVVLFQETPHFLSAQAMGDVTLLQVDGDKYLDFVHKNPSITTKIIAILGRMVSASYDRLIDLVGERVEQRVCNVLYMLSNKHGDTLHFTSEEIADLSGTTTETVIRIMSRLKSEQILQTKRGRGEIRILNVEALKELSRGPFFI